MTFLETFYACLAILSAKAQTWQGQLDHKLITFSNYHEVIGYLLIQSQVCHLLTWASKSLQFLHPYDETNNAYQAGLSGLNEVIIFTLGMYNFLLCLLAFQIQSTKSYGGVYIQRRFCYVVCLHITYPFIFPNLN
jgi:hypothetical protein